jgi:hypothetical protein
MRRIIQDKLLESKKTGWEETRLGDFNLDKIKKEFDEVNIPASFDFDQDSATAIIITAATKKIDPDLLLFPNFWKSPSEEYELLSVRISLFGKIFTTGWNVFLKEQRAAPFLEDPPNPESADLQQKIIRLLEKEGFTYVTPKECNEMFEGKSLYTWLFDYY